MTDSPCKTPDPSSIRTVTLQRLAAQLEKMEKARKGRGRAAGLCRPDNPGSPSPVTEFSGKAVSTGIEALDRLLPDAGFREGTLVEWLAESGSSDQLALLAAAPALGSDRVLIVIDGEKTFYPPAAAALGIDLRRLILVRPGKAAAMPRESGGKTVGKTTASRTNALGTETLWRWSRRFNRGEWPSHFAGSSGSTRAFFAACSWRRNAAEGSVFSSGHPPRGTSLRGAMCGCGSNRTRRRPHSCRLGKFRRPGGDGGSKSFVAVEEQPANARSSWNTTMRRILCIRLPNRLQQETTGTSCGSKPHRHSNEPAAPEKQGTGDGNQGAANLGLFDWCRRYSPLVGWAEPENPDSLLLDVTGCASLRRRRGDARQIARDFQRGGLSPRVAIADTVARPGPSHGMVPRPLGSIDRQWCLRSTVAAAGRMAEALGPLPVEGLRLFPEIVEILRDLGIETIGQLIALPRKTLPSRFGAEIVRRLDQALGHVPEPIVCQRPFEPAEASWGCEPPIEGRSAIEAVLRRLFIRVIRRLRCAMRGFCNSMSISMFLQRDRPNFRSAWCDPLSTKSGCWN